MAARKIRDKARKLAAHLLEASEEDLEWEPGKFFVKGAPSKSKTIQEIAFAAYTNFPAGLEPGLEAVHYYDPPNLTFIEEPGNRRSVVLWPWMIAGTLSIR